MSSLLQFYDRPIHTFIVGTGEPRTPVRPVCTDAADCTALSDAMGSALAEYIADVGVANSDLIKNLAKRDPFCKPTPVTKFCRALL